MDSKAAEKGLEAADVMSSGDFVILNYKGQWTEIFTRYFSTSELSYPAVFLAFSIVLWVPFK